MGLCIVSGGFLYLLGGGSFTTPPEAMAVPTEVPTVQPTEVPTQSIWGPAGAAPQSFEEAMTLLGVEKKALTMLYLAPGDPTVIGWVVGTAPYSKSFVVNLPEGVCVDYTRTSSILEGNTVWLKEYEADWNRAFMNERGTLSTFKTTVYWTTCQK